MARVFFIVFLLVLIPSSLSRAEDDSRIVEEQVQVQSVHWQLARWQDGVTVCNIYISHDMQPSNSEISHACGRDILSTWSSTPSCAEAQNGGTGASCAGLLMRYVGQNTYTYTRQVELPRIRMWVDVVDCTPGADCTTRPHLRVQAEEPLDDHNILRVHVRVGDREKIYEGADGELKLPLTDENGDWLQFWAESDFGDLSERFEVKYRSYQIGSSPDSYRFDLLTPEWESTLPSGALLWQVFPPVGDALPKLFEQPLSAGYLNTTNRYALLAGNLIRAGYVDVATCTDSGLLLNGAASACGERVAADAVLEWQNKYDQQIYDSALTNDVPARLLKGMIAQESQFWPVSDSPYERGLGYVSENGMSMLLMWNNRYYLGMCLPAYGKNPCSAGYANLREDRQTVLRGLTFNKVGTEEELDLLGAMLYASASQTSQLISNVFRTEPAEVTTYEDLWKMSIANYYAGSGCIGAAMRGAIEEEFPLSWDVVSGYLEGDCQIAKDYVQRVMQYSE